MRVYLSRDPPYTTLSQRARQHIFYGHPHAGPTRPGNYCSATGTSLGGRVFGPAVKTHWPLSVRGLPVPNLLISTVVGGYRRGCGTRDSLGRNHALYPPQPVRPSEGVYSRGSGRGLDMRRLLPARTPRSLPSINYSLSAGGYWEGHI